MVIKIVYNSEIHNIKDIIDELNTRHIKYEVYDNYYTKERKKGFKSNGAYSARLDPFIGVHQNDTPIKGFYSEASECTLNNLIKYLNESNSNR